MLTISDTSINWRSICVNIKDRQENPNAPRFRLQDFLLIQFNNVSDPAISGSNNQIGIWRHRTIWIPEKGDGEKKKRKKNKRQLSRHEQDRHAAQGQN